MKIVFFDGYCSVCNAFVDWGLRHDIKKNIRFASLQGETAKKYLPGQSYLSDIDTVVYFREGQIFDRSDAVLYFLQDLGGPVSVLAIFLIVPASIRNFFYRLFAKNRYLFFKKKDTCRLPTEAERDRLLN